MHRDRVKTYLYIFVGRFQHRIHASSISQFFVRPGTISGYSAFMPGKYAGNIIGGTYNKTALEAEYTYSSEVRVKSELVLIAVSLRQFPSNSSQSASPRSNCVFDAHENRLPPPGCSFSCPFSKRIFETAA